MTFDEFTQPLLIPADRRLLRRNNNKSNGISCFPNWQLFISHTPRATDISSTEWLWGGGWHPNRRGMSDTEDGAMLFDNILRVNFEWNDILFCVWISFDKQCVVFVLLVVVFVVPVIVKTEDEDESKTISKEIMPNCYFARWWKRKPTQTDKYSVEGMWEMSNISHLWKQHWSKLLIAFHLPQHAVGVGFWRRWWAPSDKQFDNGILDLMPSFIEKWRCSSNRWNYNRRVLNAHSLWTNGFISDEFQSMPLEVLSSQCASNVYSPQGALRWIAIAFPSFFQSVLMFHLPIMLWMELLWRPFTVVWQLEFNRIRMFEKEENVGSVA